MERNGFLRWILKSLHLGIILVIVLTIGCEVRIEGDIGDPLPSWNDGDTKEAIVNFVETITEEGGPNYVIPADRVATFDNDGTLWAENLSTSKYIFSYSRSKMRLQNILNGGISNRSKPFLKTTGKP